MIKKVNGLGEVATDEDKRTLFSALLNFFDTGIESVEGQSEEMDFDKVLDRVPKPAAEEMKIEMSNAVNEKPRMIKIDKQIFLLRKDESGNIIYNKLVANHGNQNELFEYADESDGTKRLFDLIPLFYEKSSVILVDEIDRSLHTNLIRKFIDFFMK